MDKELVKMIAEYGGAGAIVAGLLIYMLRDTLNQKLGANLPAPDRLKVSKYLLIASASIACVSVLTWGAVNFSPTLRIEAPKEPIEIKMDIKIEHNLKVKIEEELDAVLTRSGSRDVVRPDGFGNLYGEKYDGFLGVRKEKAGPSIEKYVKEENQRRLEGYVETAGRLGIGVNEVALIAGDANIRSLKRGVMFLSKNGKWTSK